MDDIYQRYRFEPLLERMAKAGLASLFCYTDGKGYDIGWTDKGDDLARTIKGLAALNGYVEYPRDVIDFNLGMDECLAWKHAVKKALGQESPLTKTEERLVFHIFIKWHPLPI